MGLSVVGKHRWWDCEGGLLAEVLMAFGFVDLDVSVGSPVPGGGSARRGYFRGAWSGVCPGQVASP